MKKVICLTLALLVSTLSLTAFAQDETAVDVAPADEAVAIEVAEIPAESEEPLYLLVINGIGYSLAYPLYMENGRTMVEAETIAQLIGVEIANADGFVSFTDGESTASLSLTADGAVLNDGAVVLDAYAAVKDEVTYVPLRFVAESFGCTVGFSPVFSDENIFLGAYITVDTVIPSNVDFTLLVPDSLTELAESIINITKTITGVTPETLVVEADKYTERINAALLAGEKIMFVKNNETAVIEDHKPEDLLLSFDAYIGSDGEEAESAESTEIYAFPVELSGETLEFAVSAGVESKDEAVYFLIGMNELIASLTAPQE